MRGWPFRRERDIVGHLDDTGDGMVRGWAWRPGNPDERPLVDIFVNGRFVGQRLANMYRPDLRDAGIGDGRHAFEFMLAPEGTTSLPPGDSISVYVLGDQRFKLRADGPKADRGKFGVDDYLRVTFSTLFTADSLQEPRDAVVSPLATGPRVFDRLFEPSPIESPLPILGKRLSGYLDHVRHRQDVASAYDTTISVDDYAAYLKYYLECYAKRRGRLRAPLSVADLAFLNDGVSDARPLAKSNAQILLGTVVLESDEAEEAFRWAIYDSVLFGVEDCLTPESHRLYLVSCDDDQRGRPFPLSRFMRRFLRGNPFLRRLDATDEESRSRAYLATFLFALRAPHCLNYVPASGIEDFLAGGPDSPFQRAMAHVFGKTGFGPEDWRARIASEGYDIDRKRFRFLTEKGDRLRSPAIAISRSDEVDVQLIGPFSRRLGVSDSCRALALALAKLDYSTRLCDFTLDHPNAVRARDNWRTSPPGRAKVNILHLNLEEIPGAFAYMPDIFTGSRTIGTPYLETSQLGPSQRLGLSLLDEIWAASKFVADAIGEKAAYIVGTACRPINRLGKRNARNRIYNEIAEAEDFIFLTACDAFSGGERKNPLGVIRAFMSAFPSGARAKLVVKTHSVDRTGVDERRNWDRISHLARQCDRIVLINRFLEDTEHMALIEGADCLVSLHRAEGFGYHMLEAMALETPVIATAYSGNMEFCSDGAARLIPYKLVNIEHGQYPHASASQTWAEPDIATCVDAMRDICSDAAGRARMTARAKSLVEEKFSLDAFARRIDRRLKPAVNGFGAGKLLVLSDALD